MKVQACRFLREKPTTTLKLALYGVKFYRAEMERAEEKFKEAQAFLQQLTQTNDQSKCS
jgi:hypothetical protein